MVEAREPSGRRLRIVHVAAPAPFGGLESMVALLAAGLLRRSHDVRVVAILDLEPAPHPFEATIARAGIEIVPIRLPHRAYLREQRELSDVLTALRPEVVHTHGYRADVQAGAVGRRLGIPTMSTLHGFIGGDWKNRLFEWLQVRSLRRAGAVVAVSQPIIERMRAAGIAGTRLHLLRTAWGGQSAALSRAQARRELGLPDDRFVVGWVGRLSFEKGADVMLEALARLAPPITLGVIGEGVERVALTERARALGVESRVCWCGARPDAGRFFAAFDVFALSSRTEGTPIVLFEALDAGVPVVAAAVGGVPDVVGPQHAWLVPPEDPAALAGALGEVHADRDEAVRRATAARSLLSERFGLDPWLDAYERIYRSLS